jgi:hypothetical protein
MREGCKSSGASKARAAVRGSSGTEKFRPGLAGVGEMTKPTGGACVVVGLRKFEEETTFGKYAKAAQAGMGRARARPAGEKGGGGGAGWAERPDGPAGGWPDWAECEGKILF